MISRVQRELSLVPVCLWLTYLAKRCTVVMILPDKFATIWNSLKVLLLGGKEIDNCDFNDGRHIWTNVMLCSERVGYVVCCQQTMNRYGNRRFEIEAADFVDKMDLHSLVSSMHSELLALSSTDAFDDRSLVRNLTHPTDPSKRLELSAAILRRQPALSLFVSRIVAAD